MLIDLDKPDVVRLISGFSLNQTDCDYLTKRGMMQFTGNQHNEDWKWSIDYLNSQTEMDLVILYNILKDCENTKESIMNYI